MKYCVALLSTLLISLSLLAQDKIETDRPDQTETPFLVPRRYFQGEIGFNREKISEDVSVYVHPTALLKYGLNRRLEFRLETNIISEHERLIPNPKTTGGLEPIELGAKLALFEEKGARPKTSIIAHLGLPFLSSKSLHTHHLAPSFRFTMQNSLTDGIALGYNLGAEWDGESGTPNWLYTFAPGFNIGERWYAYVEAFGFITKNEMPQHNVDAGIAYFLSNNTKLDFSAGKGLSSSSFDYYLALGFSFRLPVKR